MNDRPIPIDAINLHANAQLKAVFSCAMTVMDKICGWEEEQKLVGSFAACVWIYTKGITQLHAGSFEKKHVIHHGKCQLGLC